MKFDITARLDAKILPRLARMGRSSVERDSGRSKSATRMGHYLETTTEKLNGSREIAFVVAAGAADRVIPVVLTLAPYAIINEGGNYAAINSLVNAHAGVDKPSGVTVFVGVGMHGASGTTGTIFTGWDTTPGNWFGPAPSYVGPTGGDNQGRPLGLDNPAHPRNGFGVQPPTFTIGTVNVL